MSSDGDRITTNQPSPWVWMLAFDELAGALRFVFSMQYGMLTEVWKRSYMRWFPPTERGPNGRMLYHGPRITVAVHTTSLSPGGYYASKTTNSLPASTGSKKLSENNPTNNSSGRVSSGHDCSGYSSFKGASEAPPASARPGPWSQQIQNDLKSQCLPASRSCLSSPKLFATASGSHQKRSKRTLHANAFPDPDSGAGSSCSDPSAVQAAALAFEQSLSPNGDTCWRHIDTPQQSTAPPATESCAAPMQPICKPQAFVQSDTSESSGPKASAASENNV